MWEVVADVAFVLGNALTIGVIIELSGLSLVALFARAFHVEQEPKPKYLLAKLLACTTFLTVAFFTHGWRTAAFVAAASIILGVVPVLVTILRAKMGS
jgi:hypothetical protein